MRKEARSYRVVDDDDNVIIFTNVEPLELVPLGMIAQLFEELSFICAIAQNHKNNAFIF